MVNFPLWIHFIYKIWKRWQSLLKNKIVIILLKCLTIFPSFNIIAKWHNSLNHNQNFIPLMHWKSYLEKHPIMWFYFFSAWKFPMSLRDWRARQTCKSTGKVCHWSERPPVPKYYAYFWFYIYIFFSIWLLGQTAVCTKNC